MIRHGTISLEHGFTYEVYEVYRSAMTLAFERRYITVMTEQWPALYEATIMTEDVIMRTQAILFLAPFILIVPKYTASQLRSHSRADAFHPAALCLLVAATAMTSPLRPAVSTDFGHLKNNV